MMEGSATGVRRTAAQLVEELPILIGQDITIYLPGDDFGSIYTAKILSVEDRRLRINLPRGVVGSGYLRNSQPVTMTFVLDNTLYEAAADYRADDNQVRELAISGDIRKSNRRRHPRLPLKLQAVYVPISELSMTQGQLSHLKWRRCTTHDFSSGGILISTPLQVPVGSYFLINLEIESFEGPLFVFGQVRWSARGDNGNSRFQCGIMFLDAADLSQHFSRRALSTLPPMMLGFDATKQKELDGFLRKLSGTEI